MNLNIPVATDDRRELRHVRTLNQREKENYEKAVSVFSEQLRFFKKGI